MNDSITPSMLPASTPQAHVRQEKLLLTPGRLGVGRSRRVARCCTSMQVCTTITRKKTRNACLPS